MPQKILISTSSFDMDANPVLQRLASLGFEIVLNPHGRRLSEAEAGALLADGVVAMIAGVEPLTRNVMATAKKLKVISRCGTGMDSVDAGAAAEFGILLKNTPDAPARAVAELTLGMMLGILRRLPEADRGIRANQWAPLMGRLLSEQTVGLIGFGRIGRRVARLVRAFGATVIAFDTQAVDGEEGVEFKSMDEVVRGADVLSLHVAYQPDSHHLLNAARFATMKKGAVVINAARGGLIDEAALIQVLQSAHLAGAALDCFEKEPYAGPLATMSQVVLSAHMGSYAKEARALMEREAAENLLSGMSAKGLLKD